MGGGGRRREKRRPKEDPMDSYYSASDRSSDNFGNIEAYNSETAKIQETMRINQALEEFRDEVAELSEENEKKIVRYCWEMLDEFMEFLKEINDKSYNGERLRLNIRAMERDNREIIDSIHGSIKKDILSKVNLDNVECRRILEMESGKEKRRSMREFQRKVLDKSVDKLFERLKKALYKTCYDIEDRITTRLYEIIAKCDSAAVGFKEFSDLADNDSQGLEVNRLKTSYQMAVNALWLELIEENKG